MDRLNCAPNVKLWGCVWIWRVAWGSAGLMPLGFRFNLRLKRNSPAMLGPLRCLAELALRAQTPARHRRACGPPEPDRPCASRPSRNRPALPEATSSKQIKTCSTKSEPINGPLDRNRLHITHHPPLSAQRGPSPNPGSAWGDFGAAEKRRVGQVPTAQGAGGGLRVFEPEGRVTQATCTTRASQGSPASSIDAGPVPHEPRAGPGFGRRK